MRQDGKQYESLYVRLALAAWLTFVASAAPLQAQTQGYIFIRTDDTAENRIAYLLTLLRSDPGARAALVSDSVLREIGVRKQAALSSAPHECRQSTRCVVEALTLGDEGIAAAGDALARFAAPGGPLSAVVRHHMRPSGAFQRHASLDDAAFMRAAWLETAAGINRLYRVYALAEFPLYRATDSMAYEAESEHFRSILLAFLDAAADESSESSLFFDPWSRVGLDLLSANQRDEASRYEPLATGENRLALTRAARLNWRKFTYSSILVPGQGLLNEERALAAVGAARVRIAVRRYRRGLAPFLIVSGGNVYPDRTPYTEAIEMRRELMRRYGIPENAILIDPYARHTTTNLRNAVRLIYRAGAPVEIPMLVTTTREQSAYIESAGFGDRCERELGYRPHSVLDRLSPNDLVIRLNITSLHLDPRDPLDP